MIRFGGSSRFLELRALSGAISHCVRVGAGDNDARFRIDWLSKERKEGREGDDEQKERRVNGWPLSPSVTQIRALMEILSGPR